MHANGILSSSLHNLVYGVERLVKEAAFGCKMCGQCALSSTAYVCPMRCPKNLRNGPCGGSTDGMCEVDPTTHCVWCVSYERSKRLGRTERLLENQPSMDWRLFQTSAWINYVTGRYRPGGRQSNGA